MNDKTKQQIMQNRELLKGYGSWDVGEEATDEEQKLPYLPPLKGKMVKNSIPLPLYFEDIVNEKNIFSFTGADMHGVTAGNGCARQY